MKLTNTPVMQKHNFKTLCTFTSSCLRHTKAIYICADANGNEMNIISGKFGIRSSK